MNSYVLPIISQLNSEAIKAKMQSSGGFPVTFSSCSSSDGCPVFIMDFGTQTPPADGYALKVTCNGSFTPNNCSSNPSLISLNTCNVTNVSGSIYSIDCCFDGGCDMDEFIYPPSSGDACTGTATVQIVNSSGDPVSGIMTDADCPGLDS